MDNKNFYGTVVLADGDFPVHSIPLGYLRDAEHIICCDGAVTKLLIADLEPEAIIGDLDSIDRSIAERYSDRLFMNSEQETNDLTKAVRWCIGKGYNDIVILGATGKREDHTLGNISLLSEYARELRVIMVTDTGIITPCLESCTFESFPGQQVSIFSINPETEIFSEGLLYPLNERKLKNWWEATLNESTGTTFRLWFTGGPLIIYRKFAEL